MSENIGFKKEEEQKSLEVKKKKEREQESKNTLFEKEKKLAKKRETSEKLTQLKELVKEGKEDEVLKDIESIGEHISLSEKEQKIEEILKLIEEMNQNKETEKYIPEEYRVSTDEFQKALTDSQTRNQVLRKIDGTLSHIISHIRPHGRGFMPLYGTVITLFNGTLTSVQENHIDMKRLLTK